MGQKTLEQLYQEYSQLAAQAGDISYQVGRLQFRAKQLLRSMQFVQKDIGKLQSKQPAAPAPASEAPAQESAPEASEAQVAVEVQNE